MSQKPISQSQQVQTKLQSHQNYINDQIKKLDWVTHNVQNYYPSALRNAFCTINYFNQELMRIVEGTNQKHLGDNKLNFWMQCIENIYQEKPMDEPISQCLYHACKTNPIPKRLLQNMVKARKSYLGKVSIPDMVELAQIAESVRTTMILINLRLLRIDLKKHPVLFECAALVGRAIGITDFLKKIPYTLRKYVLLMPADIQMKHNISVKTLWDRRNGKPKDELFDVVLEVAAYARESLIKSKQLIRSLPK